MERPAALVTCRVSVEGCDGSTLVAIVTAGPRDSEAKRGSATVAFVAWTRLTDLRPLLMSRAAMRMKACPVASVPARDRVQLVGKRVAGGVKICVNTPLSPRTDPSGKPDTPPSGVVIPASDAVQVAFLGSYRWALINVATGGNVAAGPTTSTLPSGRMKACPWLLSGSGVVAFQVPVRGSYRTDFGVGKSKCAPQKGALPATRTLPSARSATAGPMWTAPAPVFVQVALTGSYRSA